MSDDTTTPPGDYWPKAETDSAGSPSGDPKPEADQPDLTEEGATAGAGSQPATRQRRRRLIIAGVAGTAVLLVLACCLTAGLLVRSGYRWADRADDNEDKWDRLEQSCLELETRLNRLAPPGATGGGPRQRAGAISDENAAVRPLLAELDAMSADPDSGRDRRRDEWADGWRQLVSSRTAYADGLRRQSDTGEPAFFLTPREPDGDSVVAALERHGPWQCAGPLHRLSQPDL